jgi:hypothetical protein
MAITSTGAVGTPTYLSSAYGRAAVLPDAGSGSATADSASSSASSSATVVTLSAAAQAKLAQGTIADFATVMADARAALDALYKAAKVTAPIVDGKETIDLSSLDRRALYAIASNGGGLFSADEQQVAANELKARFDAVLSPQTAVARLTGDWSQVYKAAMDYMQGAGPEEKSTATWKAQFAALQKGYDSAVATPGSPPAASGDDPVAAFLARAGTDSSRDENQRDFSAVASDVRTALDAQKKAAADKGLELVFDPARKSGQLVDWSGFDNRALSAAALNQGNQFSPQEVRAAKVELDSRTRASLLAAFKQSGASADPRAFSLGLLYNYAQMSGEERQAMNFNTQFRDMAVKNYQTTSNLISMLKQASDGLSGLFG